MANITETDVLNALRTVPDPDLNKDLVTLNMIKDVKVDGNNVSFTVVLTTPACPMKEKIKNDCIAAVKMIPDVNEIKVNIASNVSGQGGVEGKTGIPGIKNIFAVSSGKGGVGKSTMAVNIAVALAKSGASVGLMDADAYGPNIPQMMGVTDHPQAQGDRIIPPQAHGIKVISVALMTDPDQPVIWRGPMLHSLIAQFLGNVEWGELDYLVVDMPPGTGDAQLSLTQHVPLAGAVMVTTPQEVSQADVKRAIMMFRRVEVPILGVVENMAYFICPDNNKQYNIFGTGGGERLAKTYEVPFLGRIPIDPRIAVGGDTGNPIVSANPDSEIAQCIVTLTESIAQKISIANEQKVDLPTL